MNTDELEHVLYEAQARVLKIQTKLHRWARDDPHRRFDDLFNLVVDPAFLVVAWDRVRGNKGGVSDRLCKGVTSNLNRRSGSKWRKCHGGSAGHCRGGTTS